MLRKSSGYLDRAITFSTIVKIILNRMEASMGTMHVMFSPRNTTVPGSCPPLPNKRVQPSQSTPTSAMLMPKTMSSFGKSSNTE